MATTRRTCSIFLILSSLVIYGGFCDCYEYRDYVTNSTPPPVAGSVVFESYYNYSCPQAASIVNDLVDKFLAADPNMAGGLQRLHFHDCWVNGCDASVLLNSTSTFVAERDGFTNFRIRGIPEIDEIKGAIESVCPGVVSCADILALVARDATYKVGGPWWPVSLGRRDGFVSLAKNADTNLPFPNLNFNELVQNFASKGFTPREMVILSGSHTIGRSHCNGIQPQLYNFTGIDDLTNPSLDPTFAARLRQQCPKGNKENIVDMDPTKNVFDELYFQEVLAGKSVFTTDSALITDPLGLQVVIESSMPGSTFFQEFADAMVKMGNIELLTGTSGEVRKHCQFIN
ncbi:hypothetical protein Mapa_009625 [Marchantia paleacea]|nr:hypothetical protein Mapa_009625 [Marchantia paleacea]